MLSEKADVIIPFLYPGQLLVESISSLRNNHNIGKFYLVQNGINNTEVKNEKKKLIKIFSGVDNNNDIKHLIVERKNTSIAVNYGISESKANYVMFASSHSYYEDGYIDQLYDEIKNNNSIYAIGGRVVCLSGSPDKTADAVRDAFSSYLGCFSRYRSLDRQEEYFHTDRIYSAIYTKSALKKINLFDETKERAQDIDVAKRLIKSGGDAIIYPVKNVYWILTAKTPFDLYKRYFNQGYWTVKYNISNRNYFIIPVFILVIVFGILFWGPLMKNIILGIFIFIMVYSYKISKSKSNTLMVAISLILSYVGYFLGVIRALFK